jgi:aminomethyltransferase
MPDKRSPLYETHAAAGASFTDFAGWQMPVSYGSDLGEHHAVRTAAGLFDISHMAQLAVTGAEAAGFLDFALAANVTGIPLSKAKYSMVLTPEGGIIDDVIVYRNAPDEYLVIANAGNHDPVLAALHARADGFDARVTDLVGEALIAVQGPRAAEILAATPELRHDDGLAMGHTLEGLPYYACMGMRFGEGAVLVSRTGYTGEDGFEIGVNAQDAPALWAALLNAGEPVGLVPCGLAARDTLRLEAGMPLYGHELTLETQPAQAGLARAIPLRTKTADFVGRDAVIAGPPSGARVLVGLRIEGRRAGRAGYEVFIVEPDGVQPPDTPVGVITSGALSPTLGYPIAMAYLDPDVADSPLAVDVRGTRIPASVTPLPFYRREQKK